jgi:hypothetical protein
MQKRLIDAELLLLDLGATRQEVEHALGSGGFVRAMLIADRDAQIRAWMRDGATLH